TRGYRREEASELIATADEPTRTVKFGVGNEFHAELRRRVDTFFRITGRRRRDCGQMYVKTAILVAVFAAGYGLVVFGAQTWRWFHRWQHLYLWPLYGLLAIKWHLLGDFRNVIRGRIGGHRFPRPRGWPLAVFLAGKAIFLALAFGLPLAVHPVGSVLACY